MPPYKLQVALWEQIHFFIFVQKDQRFKEEALATMPGQTHPSVLVRAANYSP